MKMNINSTEVLDFLTVIQFEFFLCLRVSVFMFPEELMQPRSGFTFFVCLFVCMVISSLSIIEEYLLFGKS